MNAAIPLALVAAVLVSGCTAPGPSAPAQAQEAPALTGAAAAQVDDLLAREVEQATQSITDQDIEDALLLAQ